MRLAELRAELAPIFGMTDDAFRVRLQMLQGTGHFPARRGAKLDALMATTASSAMLILMGMMGKGGRTVKTIAPAVIQLWQAGPVTQTGNLERCDSVGAVLTLLLADAGVRSRLACVELDHDIPELAVVLNRGSRAVWAPYTPKEWQRRTDDLLAAGTLAHIFRLPAATFDKIAALIAEPEGRTPH